MSKQSILSAIANNQPELQPLPDLEFLMQAPAEDVVQKFTSTLTTIGGKVFEVSNYDELTATVNAYCDTTKRVVTTLPALQGYGQLITREKTDPHTFEDIEVSIISAHFAVAENGAVWVTEDIINQRVLPFICQHLVVVLDPQNIVPTMHQAYQQIGQAQYGFGTFISGPSKTADIEQSLVLGAHGPRSIMVFLLKQ